MFKTGYKRPLDDDDLYEVLRSCRSKNLADEMEELWDLDAKTHEQPSLLRVLWAYFGRTYVVFGVVQLIMRVVMVLIVPQALGKLVSFFSPGQDKLTIEDAYYYAAIVIGCNIVNFVYSQNYHMLLQEFGLRVRTAICSLVYRKSLKLTTESLSDITVGRIVTLITKDVMTFDMALLFGNDIWIGFVLTILICYLIYERIGVAAFAGVGFFFVILPFQVLIGRLSASYRLKTGKKTDERLQMTQETLSAIKIIKMYTWEPFFGNKIKQLRRKEINSIKDLFYMKIFIVLIGSLSGKIAFYLLIMTYVWLGNYITAEMVYYVMSLFSKMQHLLSMIIPIGITFASEVYATNTRLSSVFEGKEIPKADNCEEMNLKNPKIVLKGTELLVKDVTIFQKTYIEIKKGLNIVVGHLGSGKTTFLKMILGELPTEGHLVVSGRLSYASQEPWLFPSTIKHNILFGQPLYRDRYEEVIRICALHRDFRSLTNGDSTLVGDHGLNLSKGQQARINLARALYRDADIYLLDDCLAALDSHVSDSVFEQSVREFLKDKLVIFVTNNPEHIQKADRVILVDKGRISYAEKSQCEKIIENDFKNEEEEDVKLPLSSDDEDTKYLEPIVKIENGKIPEAEPVKKSLFHEVKKGGKVDLQTYRKYIAYGGGIIIFLLVLLIFGINQGVESFSDKLVSSWVTLEQNLTTFKIKNETESEKYQDLSDRRSSMLQLYTIIVVAATSLSLIKCMSFFTFMKKISINMHNSMMERIMNAKMQFFDTTFLGNVLNRFSKDLATIDEYLPLTVFQCCDFLFRLVGIVFLVVSVNLIFLAPLAVFVSIAVFLRYVYLRTGRSLQRLEASRLWAMIKLANAITGWCNFRGYTESRHQLCYFKPDTCELFLNESLQVTRGPLIGHLAASLEGLTTIRAFGAQEIIRGEFDRHQDLYSSANYTLNNTSRALAFALDAMCSLFSTMVIGRFLLFPSDTSVGNVGLAISQSFMLTFIMDFGIRRWSNFENQMTSVERVMEYMGTPQEPREGHQTNSWPTAGRVNFDDVSLAYQHNGKQVLKQINFVIEPAHKIGVVGRTGAGKSSIIASLFRLYDITGTITIDDIDIKTLSLAQLRSSIAIIPQDPVLFTGSIRDNIDPLGRLRDEEIWKILDEVHLREIVISLTMRVDANSMFSSGQKQLICLSRAIARRNKIVVLDEATANLDHDTDALIRDVIRRKFAHCTVITIAHRMLSVLESDMVLVVDNGRIVEMGAPSKLIEDKSGLFYKMTKQVI